MAKAGTTLKKISSGQIDKILSQVLVEKHSKFVLLGPGIALSETPDNWPDALQDSGVVYQLTEAVDMALACRVGLLLLRHRCAAKVPGRYGFLAKLRR